MMELRTIDGGGHSEDKDLTHEPIATTSLSDASTADG